MESKKVFIFFLAKLIYYWWKLLFTKLYIFFWKNKFTSFVNYCWNWVKKSVYFFWQNYIYYLWKLLFRKVYIFFGESKFTSFVNYCSKSNQKNYLLLIICFFSFILSFAPVVSFCSYLILMSKEMTATQNS